LPRNITASGGKAHTVGTGGITAAYETLRAGRFGERVAFPKCRLIINGSLIWSFSISITASFEGKSYFVSHLPVLEIRISVTKIRGSMTEIRLPETEFPPPKTGSSVSKTDPPLAKVKPPVPKAEPPPAEAERLPAKAQGMTLMKQPEAA
jgi:hypothetical protein